MGLLAWKTGGLELPILLHAANNWSLFLLAPTMVSPLEQGAAPPIALLTSTLPTVLITAGLWWWYSRREGLGLGEPARGTGQRLRGSGRARAGSGNRTTRGSLPEAPDQSAAP